MNETKYKELIDVYSNYPGYDEFNDIIHCLLLSANSLLGFGPDYENRDKHLITILDVVSSLVATDLDGCSDNQEDDVVKEKLEWENNCYGKHGIVSLWWAEGKLEGEVYDGIPKNSQSI